MSERTAFPNGVIGPGDPKVKCTLEQLNALFPDPIAFQRGVTLLVSGSRSLTTPTPLSVSTSLQANRDFAHADS